MITFFNESIVGNLSFRKNKQTHNNNNKNIRTKIPKEHEQKPRKWEVHRALDNGSVIAILCKPSFEYLSAGNEGVSVTESNNSKGC